MEAPYYYPYWQSEHLLFLIFTVLAPIILIRFLKHGDKVKVLIKFKGREITYPEYAQNILNRLVEAVSDISTVEKHPVLDGKSMIMILAPKN